VRYLELAKQAEARFWKDRQADPKESRGCENAKEVRPTPGLQDADIAVALSQLEWEIQTGHIAPVPSMVRGQPIGLLLGIDEVARLLRRDQRRGEP